MPPRSRGAGGLGTGRNKKLERENAAEREAHKRECEECRRGEFCSKGLSFTKEQSKRWNKIKRLKGMIWMEGHDQGYADHARAHGVVYEDHVLNGFCSYWQNVRHRKFCSVDWKCEGCGEHRPLEGHHCTEGDPDKHLGFV